MEILILGSKEFPMGTSDDQLKSGGMEVYLDNFSRALPPSITQKIVTRRFKGTSSHEIISPGVEVFRVSWLQGFFLRNISFNITALKKSLDLDFDKILANGLFATLSGYFISKIKKKSLISVPHGLAGGQPQYPSIVRYMLKKLEGFAYSHSHMVIFLSPQEKRNFNERMGYLPKKWEIIPSGVDFSQYENLDSSRIKTELELDDNIVVTFVGRLVGVKGLEYLIQGLKHITHKNYKLVIVGDGPQKGELTELAESEGVSDKIIFAGWRSDIPQVLAVTDIFVLPSLSEGLPMALLEAMASGCACVVTDVGLPEDLTRFLEVVPPKEPGLLGTAVANLMTDLDKRKKMGEKGRGIIKENYTWEKVVGRYLEVFWEA